MWNGPEIISIQIPIENVKVLSIVALIQTKKQISKTPGPITKLKILLPNLRKHFVLKNYIKHLLCKFVI